MHSGRSVSQRWLGVEGPKGRYIRRTSGRRGRLKLHSQHIASGFLYSNMCMHHDSQLSIRPRLTFAPLSMSHHCTTSNGDLTRSRSRRSFA